jgi:NADP-dependent 3-hydroxy acid dehydrogenase YdfG
MQARDRGFVITGAGSGLGAATARRLVKGASILLLDRNIAAAQDLCDELGDRSIAVRADVTSAADVESAMDGAIWMAPK